MTFPLNYVTPDSLSNGDCMDKFDSATRWAGTFPVRVGGHTVIPSKPGEKTPGILSYKEYTGSGSRAPTNSEVVSWREQARREGGEPLLLCDHPTDPSRSLAVVDVDDPAYFPVFEAAMATYGVDASAAMIVTTGRDGGGRHYYFRREPMEALAYSQANGARAFLDRMGHSPVDLKGVRSYVVCPGATHKSGRVYEATVNGQPVPSLAEVVASLPVMPLKVWQAMKAPSAFLVTDESPSGAELGTFSFDDYAPAAQAAYGKVSDSGWSTVWRPTSHPAYSVFSPLVGRKTSLYVDPATGEVGTGDSPTGRLVSRNARGELVVTDWALMVHTIFTDKERAGDSPKISEGSKQRRDPLSPPKGLSWGGWGTRMLPLEAAPIRKGGKPYIRGGFCSPVEVWQAGKGTGKTEAANRKVREVTAFGNRAVVVVPSQALSREASRRFGLPNYQDLKGRIRGSVSVCGPSFHRVDLLGDMNSEGVFALDDGGGAPTIDILIYDECEQLFSQLRSTLYTSAEAARAYNHHIEAIKSAKQVLFLDADAGPETEAVILSAGREDQASWRVGPGDPERDLSPILGGKKAHFKMIQDRVKSDMRIAVACSSKNDALDLAHLVGKGTPEAGVLCIVGGEDHDPKLAARVKAECPGVVIHNASGGQGLGGLLTESNLKKFALLIYTPVIGTGVSIDAENTFWEVHGLTSANVGDGRMFLQMIHRVRNPMNRTVYVSGTLQKAPPEWKMDPEEIAKRALRNATLQKDTITAGKRKVGKEVSTEAPYELSQTSRGVFRLSCIGEASSNANGAGWVFRWLFGDKIDKGADRPATEEEKMIGKEVRKIREERHEAEALEIAGVNPSSLVGVDPEADTTPGHVKRAMSLCRVFGGAYELADLPRRKEIARADRTGDLRKRARRFALALATYDNAGLEALVGMAEKELETATPDRVMNPVLEGSLLRKVSKMLGIDLKNPAAVRLSVEAVHAVVAYAKDNRSLFDAVGVAIPSDVDARPVPLVSELLSRIGLSLDIKKLRGGEGANKTHKRVYTINEASHAEMLELSREYLNRFLGKESPEPGTRGRAIAFGAGASDEVLGRTGDSYIPTPPPPSRITGTPPEGVVGAL